MEKGKKKRKVIGYLFALYAVGVSILVLMPLLQGMVESPPGLVQTVIPSHVDFSFTRTISISASRFSSTILNVTIPGNSTHQTVEVHQTYGPPHEIYTLGEGTVWEYSFTGSATITISYEGVLYAAVWNYTTSLGPDAIPSPYRLRYNHAEYLGSSRVIDPDAFRDVTEQITADESTVVGKLRAIYDYIVEHFQYETQTSGLPKTAVETWNSGSGDCDELSFVFASMARSIGIPAWLEFGFLYNPVKGEWGRHAWIRTVVPLDGGRVEEVNIDVTAEVGGTPYGFGFLVRDPYRVTIWEDDGNSEHLTSFYSFITHTGGAIEYTESIVPLKFEEHGNIVVHGMKIPSFYIYLIAATIAVIVFLIITKKE